MEERDKRDLERIFNQYNQLYTEKKAYKEFLNEIKNDEFLKTISLDEIKKIYKEPPDYAKDVEKDEHGGIIGQDVEFIKERRDLKDLPFHWITLEIQNSITTNKFYKDIVKDKIGNMKYCVKDLIETHALHILARCTNPNDWDKNRRGLVYGQVQSGKTANMITLMGLARVSGYRVFIILAGDKKSLRDQTQKRINDAFNIDQDINIDERIRSLTPLNGDYNDSYKGGGFENGINFWRLDGDHQNQNTYIICIKKQDDNLKKLYSNLQEIKSGCENGDIDNLNFDTDFKTMIIDDEADYASIDNQGRLSLHGSSTINQNIQDIRNILKQNCYISYTATPQACFGANPKKDVGYPEDFVWLLTEYEELNKNNQLQTYSYLGSNEFFKIYPEFLITRLNDNAWPFWNKDKKPKDPNAVITRNGKVQGKKLTDIEKNHINDLIKDYSLGEKNDCLDFKKAIIDFLITCAIRWHRHYIKCFDKGYFNQSLPTIHDIEQYEQRNSETTKDGFKPFPYHAMMFNFAYIKDNQTLLIKLIELIFDDIEEEWYKKSINGENFKRQYEIQINKSDNFYEQIPDFDLLEEFLNIAVKITKKRIHADDKYIYKLNSSDEGQTLKYSSPNYELRPKKSAIIIGGHTLSRGLTINNLSVSVFARSQATAVGDTNLQMCRWFGHKRIGQIDLLNVYMQTHAIKLFNDITDADKRIRYNVQEQIHDPNILDSEIILHLFSSNLFKATSPIKSWNLTKLKNSSFSGKEKTKISPLGHEDYSKNIKILEKFERSNSSNHLDKDLYHNTIQRHFNIYPDMHYEEFKPFIQEFRFDENPTQISINKYLDYIEDWFKYSEENESSKVPNFTVAVHNPPKPMDRARLYPKHSDLTDEEIKAYNPTQFGPLKYGQALRNDDGTFRKKRFAGDQLIDHPQSYHDKLESAEKRPKGSNILVVFYKIDSNYINKTLKFNKSDKGYIDDRYIVSFKIATPVGGPVYDVQVNKQQLIDSQNG